MSRFPADAARSISPRAFWRTATATQSDGALSRVRTYCCWMNLWGLSIPMIRAGLQRDLKEVFARTNTTVLLVTHDLVEASWFADRVCVLESGTIVQQGSFVDIVERPASDFVRAFVNSQVMAK